MDQRRMSKRDMEHALRLHAWFLLGLTVVTAAVVTKLFSKGVLSVKDFTGA